MAETTDYVLLDSEQIVRKGSIAVFCETIIQGKEPVTNDYYLRAYQDFMMSLKQRGIEVYLVTDNASYLGAGKFSVGHTLSRRDPLDKLVAVPDITVNLVFDRADFTGTDLPVINNPYVQKVGTDKIEMYKNFAKFQPFSMTCHNLEEIKQALPQFEGDKVVIKEPVSFGGQHVYIDDKDKILAELPDRYPLLVQEFLDTTLGIAGMPDGVQDIRLHMCGGELIGAYIRTAKPGLLRSNTYLGGSLHYIPLEQVPAEPVHAAKEIDELFSAFPRYYSADFVNTPKGWKLLEINALLALVPNTDSPEAIKLNNRLSDYMAHICTESL